MSEVVLGIDTSTRVCVGLARDGEILASRNVGDSRSHAELLMVTIEEILAEAGLSATDLSGIAVGMGPGPFTGLRVGIVTATTLAIALNIEVFHVCGLDVLALDVAANNPDQDFITCIDARRKELYWARYDCRGHRMEGPFVTAPDRLPALETYGPAVSSSELNAGLLAAHARDLPDVGVSPLYLRHADTSLPGTTKSVLGSQDRR